MLQKFINSANKRVINSICFCVGASAVTGTEIDCIVNQYSGVYCNPFLSWGKYRKHWFRVTLPISFQFHHVQMDGGEAAKFLERLQQTLNVKFC